MPVYGDATVPGAPGTWDRAVWWALNRAARVGAPSGRHRWRSAPPFHYQGLLVTSGTPRLPWGRSTVARARLTHVPHTILFAWRGERLAGRMVAWWCGARTAYFVLLDDPGSQVCRMCLFRRDAPE